MTVSGGYNHPANDWKDGSLRFDMATSGVDLAQVKHVQDFESGLGGRADLKAGGGAKIVNGLVDLTSLNGELSVRNAIARRPLLRQSEVTAATKLPLLTLAATATCRTMQIHGSGEWRMEGDYRGEAHVPIPRISFATLHDLSPGKHVRKDLPFEGFVEGEASITGPLNQPSLMKADVTLSTVQFNASPNTRPVAGVQLQDLVLRNAQPIHVVAANTAIDFGHASFVAKDTTLDAAGRLALNSKTPWDVAIQGRINFSILEIFNPDLLGSGASVVNVAVRGPLTEPQVEGRLELQNASLFLRDVPNGVDQANGLILFDRNRATVQNLTAQSGGGEIPFESGSFLGFRGAALVYRLQATARNVRYRSAEGISVTADGSLALVGTSESSVLSGSVSVTRAAFNPRTDVGDLARFHCHAGGRATPTSICTAFNWTCGSLTTAHPRSGNFAHPEHPGRRRSALARHARPSHAAGTCDRQLRPDRVLRQQVQHQSRRNQFQQSRQDRAQHQHGFVHAGARHHGEHQLLGLFEQAEFLLSFRSAAGGLRHHRVAGRGAHALHRRSPGLPADRQLT